MKNNKAIEWTLITGFVLLLVYRGGQGRLHEVTFKRLEVRSKPCRSLEKKSLLGSENSKCKVTEIGA